MSDTAPLVTAQETFAAALPLRAQAAETVALEAAMGRTLQSAISAPTDLPPYHRAIVEGFVVRVEDTQGAADDKPIAFTVVGKVQPGDDQCPAIGPGQAVEIMTGSLVPDGPYAIVRMWEANRAGQGFTITRPFPPRFFIEDQGCDMQQGAVVFPAGTLLGPRELGTLAELGLGEVSVAQPVRVTVFACGDEVIPFREALRPGLIRDSNSLMLAAAVHEAGGTAHCAGIMRDDFEAFVTAARAALEHSDMLVISGGTAAGGRDFISELVQALGDLRVDGVPMRSGRPLIMGEAQGKPIVCVAGHPPEALRGFRLFGVAAINRLLGRELPLPEDSVA